MHINWGFFQFASWAEKNTNEKGFWFRIFGKGLHFNRGRMSFSERNGYEKYFLLGQWIIKKLKKINREE